MRLTHQSLVSAARGQYAIDVLIPVGLSDGALLTSSLNADRRQVLMQGPVRATLWPNNDPSVKIESNRPKNPSFAPGVG